MNIPALPSLRSLLELALYQSREGPSPHWPPDILAKIGRDDLCANARDSDSRDRALQLIKATSTNSTFSAATKAMSGGATASAHNLNCNPSVIKSPGGAAG